MYRLAHSEEFGRPPPRAVELQGAGDVDVFPGAGNGRGVLKSAAAPADLNQVARLANGQRRFWLRFRRWWRWRRQSAADGNGVSAVVAVGGGDGNGNGVVSFGQSDLMSRQVGVGVVGGDGNTGVRFVRESSHRGGGRGMTYGGGVVINIAGEVDGNAAQRQRAQRVIA